jgi:hypothetical protein
MYSEAVRDEFERRWGEGFMESIEDGTNLGWPS